MTEGFPHRKHSTRTRLHLSSLVAVVVLLLALGTGGAYAAYVISSNSQIGPNTVSGHHPPSGYHANLVLGSLNGVDLAANAIPADDHCLIGPCTGSTKIADGAVSTSEIAGGAVKSAQLATGAVTSGKLAAGAVGNGQLGTNAVTGDKVKDGSLTGADLAAKSIGSQQINEQSLAQGQAYSAYHDSTIAIPPDGTQHILNLSLPAGTYLILGKVVGDEQPDAVMDCTTYGANTSDHAEAYGEGNSGSTLTTTTVASGSSPFTIEMDCHASINSVFVSDAKLTAVSLASNHVYHQ